MKRTLLHLWIAFALSFPRQNRRGLIEAEEAGRPIPCYGAFPGRIAGASLKRAPPNRRPAPAAPFPRQNRRGLIEAAMAACSFPRRSRAFPGRIAGASLKLVHVLMVVGETATLSPAESPGPH